MTIEERFWDKVVMGYGGECFEWGGAINPQTGYGTIHLRKEGCKSIPTTAHRFAWELVNGPIPEGMFVCHHCDRRSCVRIDHLFLGTQKDNMQDAWRKGRIDRGPKWYVANFVAQRRRREKGTSTWVRGEDVGNHKLSEADVLKIQEMEGGAPSTEIAPLFGLHSSTIRRIWHRQTWAHLALVAACLLSACARTDIYFPPDGKSYVGDGGKAPQYHRAVVLNGSDSLGDTVIDVTRDGVRFASAGGIDNSTSTREGYRTIRHAVGTAAAAAMVGIAVSEASSAYSANQAASSASNVAASKAASATVATKGATAVQLSKIQAASALKAAEAAKALPAAGSTINAVTPATVIPVP